VIGTDCIGSYKSNYHTITTSTAPHFKGHTFNGTNFNFHTVVTHIGTVMVVIETLWVWIPLRRGVLDTTLGDQVCHNHNPRYFAMFMIMCCGPSVRAFCLFWCIHFISQGFYNCQITATENIFYFSCSWCDHFSFIWCITFIKFSFWIFWRWPQVINHSTTVSLFWHFSFTMT